MSILVQLCFLALPAFVWVASPLVTPLYSPLKLRGGKGVRSIYFILILSIDEACGRVGRRTTQHNPSTPPLKLREG